MRGRILALDYGTKRIGVALSDELWWTAQPLETFERRTLEQDVSHIAMLVAAHNVKRVVVGLPIQLKGQEGPAVRAMHEFLVRLEAGLSVPLVLWDERLTTKEAEEVLIAADVSRKKRKKVVDRVAASLLLQQYLSCLTAPAAGATQSEGEAEEEAPRVDSTEIQVPQQDEHHHEDAPCAVDAHRHRSVRARGVDSVADDSMG
ncbi:MAG: Holliday junction resolvase RuvX [Nitrospira sp.]|nr:Holliday junction resolvase RuvX [Nitrospira sp.]